MYKKSYKPILHKKGKRWIVIGLSTLALIGFGAVTNSYSVQAKTNQPVNKIQNSANQLHNQLVNNQVKQTQKINKGTKTNQNTHSLVKDNTSDNSDVVYTPDIYQTSDLVVDHSNQSSDNKNYIKGYSDNNGVISSDHLNLSDAKKDSSHQAVSDYQGKWYGEFSDDYGDRWGQLKGKSSSMGNTSTNSQSDSKTTLNLGNTTSDLVNQRNHYNFSYEGATGNLSDDSLDTDPISGAYFSPKTQKFYVGTAPVDNNTVTSYGGFQGMNYTEIQKYTQNSDGQYKTAPSIEIDFNDGTLQPQSTKSSDGKFYGLFEQHTVHEKKPDGSDALDPDNNNNPITLNAIPSDINNANIIKISSDVDTSNLIFANQMFEGMPNLEEVELPKDFAPHLQNADMMFNQDSAFEGKTFNNVSNGKPVTIDSSGTPDNVNNLYGRILDSIKQTITIPQKRVNDTVTFVDDWDSSDGLNNPKSHTYKNVPVNYSTTISAPNGYTLVSSDGNETPISSYKITFDESNNCTVHVVPLYQDLRAKYNQSNGTLEFLPGNSTYQNTTNNNLKNHYSFLAGNNIPSYVRNAKHIVIDNGVHFRTLSNITHMFANDPNVESISLPSDFDTSDTKSMSDIFYKDSDLSDLNINSSDTKFNSSANIQVASNTDNSSDVEASNFYGGSIGSFSILTPSESSSIQSSISSEQSSISASTSQSLANSESNSIANSQAQSESLKKSLSDSANSLATSIANSKAPSQANINSDQSLIDSTNSSKASSEKSVSDSLAKSKADSENEAKNNSATKNTNSNNDTNNQNQNKEPSANPAPVVPMTPEPNQNPSSSSQSQAIMDMSSLSSASSSDGNSNSISKPNLISTPTQSRPYQQPVTHKYPRVTHRNRPTHKNKYTYRAKKVANKLTNKLSSLNTKARFNKKVHHVHSLNHIKINEVAKYRGHKLIRVRVPSKLHHIRLSKSTLRHISYTHNLAKLLRKHHSVSAKVTKIFIIKGHKYNYIQAIIKANHKTFSISTFAHNSKTRVGHHYYAKANFKHHHYVQIVHGCFLYKHHHIYKHMVAGKIVHVLGMRNNKLVVKHGVTLTANKFFVKVV